MMQLESTCEMEIKVFNVKARMGRKKRKWVLWPDLRLIRAENKSGEVRHFIHQVTGNKLTRLSSDQTRDMFLSIYGIQHDGITIRAANEMQRYVSIPAIIF